MKVLLLENVNPNVVKLLETNYPDISVTHHKTSLSEDQLIEQLPNYDIIGIRSRTNLTKHVIENNKHVVAICCFCIGTNQVDLETATKYNIPVFNSPYMNTRSVAELVISHIIALARQTYIRNMEMHNQHWNKTSKNCYEIRGKTLGIIGYGHVGSQVGTLAEMMGMEVIFYDIAPVLARGNSKPMDSLTQLLANADFVSIHVPLSDETNNLFGENEFKLMKNDSYLINTSRGTVVDLDSLATHIESGHLSGAAIDVYPIEPKENGCHWEHPLQKYNNVILTPHIGGATEEAQAQIGLDMGYKIINYVKFGSTVGCVNMPEITSGEKFKNGGQIIINFHNNVPGYLSKINKIFEEENVNIDKQILSTHNETAYLLIKISKKYDKEVVTRLVTKISNLDANSRTYLND